MRDEGVARSGARAREMDVRKGKGVAPFAGREEERGGIEKLKERMEMMMGKFGRLLKGMMLGKDVDAVGERMTMAVDCVTPR